MDTGPALGLGTQPSATPSEAALLDPPLARLTAA